MYALADRSIIVTGGGSGIGRETAILAARSGARVTFADVSDAAGKDTLAAIVADGGTAQFVRTDISREEQVEALVNAAVKTYGYLDGAFNNAAIPQVTASFHELSDEAFRRSMDVNVLGTFYCMKHEIIAMRAHGSGAIVNTSSTAGVVAFPLAAEYIASKHAVIGLTKSAALEYAAENIRVNAILPGATLTTMLRKAMQDNPDLESYLLDLQPLGRMAEPSEMATAAVWLLSSGASFVTGASLPVDGGQTAK